MDERRRRFFTTAAAGGAVLLFGTGVGHAAAGGAEKSESLAEEVLPVEDLMREHGVLRRVLLIYAEGIRRIDAKQEIDPRLLGRAARVIRQFIEDYHERDEERFVFPRFRQAKKMVELVDVLVQQHQAGRRATGAIEHGVSAASFKSETGRRQVAEQMKAFVRMYAPHADREDTVLFPAFRSLLHPGEYEELGDKFEGEERRLFGQDGFERMVAEVAAIERALGLYDLAQFTPR